MGSRRGGQNVNKTEHYGKWFLTRVKKAVGDYRMIEPGDRVAAGVSGGKDSTALLYILAYLRDYSHLRFELEAVMLDLGWGEVDFEPHREFCRRLGVPLHIHVRPVAGIIRDKEGMNPCKLCGKLRAGILNQAALSLGANRVALGHHLDDVIETYLLNLIFTGQMKTFRPSTYLTNTGLTLIRPLVYLPERVLSGLTAGKGFPVIENPCPYNGRTKRDEMKAVVTELASRYPKFRERFLSGLQNVDLENLWEQRRPGSVADAEELRTRRSAPEPEASGGARRERGQHGDAQDPRRAAGEPGGSAEGTS
ncbi:PP-loop domain protein [Candidatus Desulforudis audaxviator MP104C]|uniref:PP-loop domain protein n=1 Tax=Desulforudis audaxviator (strain MP104C) TaxID=477974 RepID=B1I340_DESAP|nr:PP-loop domain protein [Candidatus Desulforudis audaxviator MP104C]